MQNKKIFLVIGMHRSGTSFVVRCLSSLGLRLSKKLVPGANDNPNVFFEDAKIVESNVAIEEALGRQHVVVNSTFSLPKMWQESEFVKKIFNEIREYLLDVISLNNRPLEERFSGERVVSNLLNPQDAKKHIGV